MASQLPISPPQILCNDCQARSTAPFHVLGMKCSNCGSYNTAQDGGLVQEEQREAQGQVQQQQEEEEQIEEQEEEQQEEEKEAQSH